MTTMMILKVLKTRTIQTSRRLMIPTMTPTNPRPNRKKPKQNPSSCFLLSFEMSVGIYPLEFQLETKVMFVAAFHVVVVVDPLGFRFAWCWLRENTFLYFPWSIVNLSFDTCSSSPCAKAPRTSVLSLIGTQIYGLPPRNFRSRRGGGRPKKGAKRGRKGRGRPTSGRRGRRFNSDDGDDESDEEDQRKSTRNFIAGRPTVSYKEDSEDATDRLGESTISCVSCIK